MGQQKARFIILASAKQDVIAMAQLYEATNGTGVGATEPFFGDIDTVGNKLGSYDYVNAALGLVKGNSNESTFYWVDKSNITGANNPLGVTGVYPPVNGQTGGWLYDETPSDHCGVVFDRQDLGRKYVCAWRVNDAVAGKTLTISTTSGTPVTLKRGTLLSIDATNVSTVSGTPYTEVLTGDPIIISKLLSDPAITYSIA